MPDSTDTIRATLAAERQRRGMSQQQLGQLLGRRTYSNVNSWERGVREPTLANFLQWAAALGFRVELAPIGGRNV